MTLLYDLQALLSIPTDISVQCRAYSASDLYFPLVGVCFAADDLVYTDLDLLLALQATQGLAEQPVLGLRLGTIEVLGRPCPYRLQHGALRLGSDSDVVLARDDELVYDVIAI
jgi:hypothetical protein